MNKIIIHSGDSRTVIGLAAHNLAFSTDWQLLLKEHPMQDKRFYVFEQVTGKAPILHVALHTLRGAQFFATGNRVLVYHAPAALFPEHPSLSVSSQIP